MFGMTFIRNEKHFEQINLEYKKSWNFESKETKFKTASFWNNLFWCKKYVTQKRLDMEAGIAHQLW